jgi:adenine-specific DNA-methyltransferase
MPTWNPDLPESWARALGMVAVPLFGPARALDYPGIHAVLLDGDRASFAFTAGNADQLPSDVPLSWSWSSNLRHTLIFDSGRRVLLVRRWDKPAAVQEYANPDIKTAQQVIDSFDAAKTLTAPTVIDRMITIFRIIRSNIDELGGNPVEVLHTFNALLVGTDASRRGIISQDEWSRAGTLGEALALIEGKKLAGLEPSMVSSKVRGFAIQELAQALIERDPMTQYFLDPDLLIRHAAGALYQEAHAELRRLRQKYHQPSLFTTVSLDAPAPSVAAGRDIQFTPTTLARALVQTAVNVLRSLRGTLDQIVALDPACGSGEFLIETVRELAPVAGQDLLLRGVDSSPVSCAMTNTALLKIVPEEAGKWGTVNVEVRCDDSLTISSWGSPDLILMNPPFVAWENMSGEERVTVKGILGGLYHGRPDKAMAFVWKGVQSLGPGTVLAALIPAPFLESRAAFKLRRAIDADKTLALHMVGYFGDFGYFSGPQVEPAFIVIGRSLKGQARNAGVQVVLAGEGNADKAIREFRKEADSGTGSFHEGWEVFRASRSDFTPESWMPRSRRATRLIRKLSSANIPTVRQLFEVKLGIRTGGNDVFIVSEEWVRQLGESERLLFRPVAGNDTINGGTIRRSEYVFYPYGDDRKPLFQSDDELEKAAPRYYSTILAPNRDRLAERKSIRKRHWWELSEPRTTWQSKRRQKLVSSYFADSGKFAYDATGECAVVQGFGWLWKKGEYRTPELPFAYLALLNSPIFQTILGLFCPHVQNGELDLSPRFVKRVFIPDLDDSTQESTERVADLAAIGRLIARRAAIDLESLDRAVAEAYGIPLDELRGRVITVEEVDSEPVRDDVRKQFLALVKQWKKDTVYLSLATRMAAHPSYRQIVAMGWPVVPLLIAELRRKPDHWFIALEEITGENPVTPEDEGNVKKMAGAWVRWWDTRRAP